MANSSISLAHIIPREGLVVADRKPVTVRPQRDKIVLTKLQQANVVGAARKDIHKYCRNLDSALEAMFTAASQPELRSKLREPTKTVTENVTETVTKTAGKTVTTKTVTTTVTKDSKGDKDDDGDSDDEGGYLDYVDAVKAQTAWATALTSPVFADFFTALLRARVQWNENPREPLDKSKHSATAKAIQALLDSEPGL
ncbi:glutamate carboxypeptidase 2 protein [Apiospora saccharicola]